MLQGYRGFYYSLASDNLFKLSSEKHKIIDVSNFTHISGYPLSLTSYAHYLINAIHVEVSAQMRGQLVVLFLFPELIGA